MQTIGSSIWTSNDMTIFYDDNRYTTRFRYYHHRECY